MLATPDTGLIVTLGYNKRDKEKFKRCGSGSAIGYIKDKEKVKT